MAFDLSGRTTLLSSAAMTFDPFAALLDEQPLERLTTLRDQIDAELTRLSDYRGSVDRAITKKRPRASQSSGRGVAKSRRRGDKRELIEKVVKTNPGAQWLPVEVEKRLAEMGKPSSRDSIRVTMRRMVEEGRLRRHPSGNGFMGLASVNGSDQEPLTEAQSGGRGVSPGTSEAKPAFGK